MFDSIGFTEMLLVAVIALIVLGPEKFPEYAKIFLRATRDLQGYVKGIREDLAKEVNPLKGELDKLKRQDPEKLLDALMKTGDKEEKKEEKKEEQKNDGSKELVAGGGYGSDTPESDADSHPYGEGAAASVTETEPEASTEPAPSQSSPVAEPAQTGEGATSAEKQDFQYQPPERMD